MGRMPNWPDFLRFASQNDASLWHEQNSFNWDQWDHLLSDAEREGIRSYTGIWYSAMNTMLREGQALRSECPEVHRWRDQRPGQVADSA